MRSGVGLQSQGGGEGRLCRTHLSVDTCIVINCCDAGHETSDRNQLAQLAPVRRLLEGRCVVVDVIDADEDGHDAGARRRAAISRLDRQVIPRDALPIQTLCHHHEVDERRRRVLLQPEVAARVSVGV